jgi:hypothetical protein
LGLEAEIQTDLRHYRLGEGRSRSTWYRRRPKARQQAEPSAAMAAREAMFDRLEWMLAELRAGLVRVARFADEEAISSIGRATIQAKGERPLTLIGAKAKMLRIYDAGRLSLANATRRPPKARTHKSILGQKLKRGNDTRKRPLAPSKGFDFRQIKFRRVPRVKRLS